MSAAYVDDPPVVAEVVSGCDGGAFVAAGTGHHVVEGVFTAVLAWFVFKENVDRRIALGMLAIIAGAALLSVRASTEIQSLWPSFAGSVPVGAGG